MNSTFQAAKIQNLMLKLSGEILAGKKGFGFDDAVCDTLTDELIELRQHGYGLAIVFGDGGNIFRGR
jgi:uridylate kinase